VPRAVEVCREMQAQLAARCSWGGLPQPVFRQPDVTGLLRKDSLAECHAKAKIGGRLFASQLAPL
jgi:hypothetical protein